MMSPFLQHAAGRARIAEDQRRIVHRGRADDEEVDVAAAFQDGGAGCGAQLVFLHARLGARHHRLHGVLAQHAGLAHAVELLGAVDRQQLVQEALGEDQLDVGQAFAQHVVLVDRQVVAVARIDLHQPDAAALELELAQALDHHLGVLAVAAVAHVLDGDRDLPAHRFGVRAAHGIDHGRLAIERHQHVAAQRVPFPMAGEPQHAAAEAPVARAARRDDAVELVLAHLVAQRRVAAGVFLLGELLPHAVAVVRRVAHVGERDRLVELGADRLPRLRPERPARLFVHGQVYSVQLPMVTRPPAFSTASLASSMLATCSTVGFLASSMSPLETLLSIDHCGALGIEALVHRPHAVLGQHVAGVFDRLLRLLGRLHDDRHDLVLLAIDRAIGLDHGRDGVAQQRAVARDPLGRGAVGVEHVVRHQVDQLDQHVQARLLLLGEEDVLRVQRDAVDLVGDQAGQPAGRGRRDELRILDREVGGSSAPRGPCAS